MVVAMSWKPSNALLRPALLRPTLQTLEDFKFVAITRSHKLSRGEKKKKFSPLFLLNWRTIFHFPPFLFSHFLFVLQWEAKRCNEGHGIKSRCLRTHPSHETMPVVDSFSKNVCILLNVSLEAAHLWWRDLISHSQFTQSYLNNIRTMQYVSKLEILSNSELLFVFNFQHKLYWG